MYIAGFFDYGTSVRRKFRTAKIIYEENSLRQKFRTAKNPTPKKTTATIPSAGRVLVPSTHVSTYFLHYALSPLAFIESPVFFFFTSLLHSVHSQWHFSTSNRPAPHAALIFHKKVMQNQHYATK